ncbi:hypothetical protein EON80_31090 [bacterium]|nr:MAG: hypothetical protein EON80_31090 [bacterium]
MLTTIPLMVVLVWSGIQAQNHGLVTRQHPYSLISGMPRSVAFLSLILVAAFVLLIGRSARPHFKTYWESHNQSPWPMGIALFLALSLYGFGLFFCPWSLIQALNGTLDFGPSRTLSVKATQKTKIGSTPYYLVQDWKNSKGWVYFIAHSEFTQAHPIGSTFTLKTKPGFLGYEWIESGYSVYCQNLASR